MSIEDFLTEEVKASGINIRVTTHLDVDGYAKEVVDEVDEQVFHAVAIRKGYVKERTCHMFVSPECEQQWADSTAYYCSACGHGNLDPIVGGYCRYCGARVVTA